MTYDEIIKALERCPQHTECCYCNSLEECGNKRILTTSVLDLINRQKKEIERLGKESKDKERAYTDEYCLRKEWQSKCRDLLEEKQTVKSEAIKEFAEKLKHEITSAIDTYYNSNGGGYYLAEDVIDDIDNIVKEMTEISK